MEQNLSELVPVQLDRERHLLITFGGIRKAERVCGVQLLGRSPFEGAQQLHGYLFACLVHECPDLTPDKLDEIIDQVQRERRMEAVTLALMDVFKKHYGIKDEEVGQEKNG